MEWRVDYRPGCRWKAVGWWSTRHLAETFIDGQWPLRYRIEQEAA